MMQNSNILFFLILTLEARKFELSFVRYCRAAVTVARKLKRGPMIRQQQKESLSVPVVGYQLTSFSHLSVYYTFILAVGLSGGLS